MNKKLTLSLDQQVIKKAKEYAKDHKVSLSKLVEAYLSSIVEKDQPSLVITPLVKSLRGVVSIPQELDDKQAYTDYLLEKY